MSCSPKEWSDAQHALEYLNLADSLPHRSEGDSVLEDLLPEILNEFWIWELQMDV